MDSLAPTTQKQVTFLLKQQQEQTLVQARKDEESILHEMEVVDFVDAASGKAQYQLFLYPFDDGSLLAAEGTADIGALVQGGFDLIEPNPELLRALAAAWNTGHKKLKIQQDLEFGEPKPAGKSTTKAAAPSLDDKLAALLEKWKGEKNDVVKTNTLFDGVIKPMFTEWRVLPVLRPDEINDEQKKVLRFLVEQKLDGGSLFRFGLPRYREWADRKAPNASPLGRFLGLVPPSDVDTPIKVDGKTHPLWTLVSDVLYELRAPEDVLKLIFAQVTAPKLLAAWKQLVRADSYAMRDMIFSEKKAWFKGNDGVSDEHRFMVTRFVDLLITPGE